MAPFSETQNSASPQMSKETPQWPSESAILVAVRVRPFSPSEQARLPAVPTNKFNFTADASLSGPGSSYDGHSPASHSSSNGAIRKVVDVLDERVLVFDPPDAESISKYKRALLPVQAYRRFKDMRYAFDRVFHEDAQQEEVFENTTKHLIDGVLNGYNGTLFAYGATGCGKTHTISGTPEKPGIIFLTMQELYERMQEQADEKTIEISLSYLEVYNETIRDLLIPANQDGPKPAILHLREDSSKKISIAGLSEHHPKDMDALMDLVFMGNANRTMSPTEANATSSRSHAVLQINICQRLKTADVSEDFTVATLSLIDLAGSERASATKNRGNRLIEGANINKSLLALGNCINALCDNKPKAHIPYRDSKLTRLLKFSLGGNCKTVMIACVSPSTQHYEETHNTLKYANRAKNIKTKVTKNTLNVDRHVSEYVQAIYELRQEVAELKGKLHNQAKSEEIERAQQKQDMISRQFEETIQKMRATFQAARTQETGYAQVQAQTYITSARLQGLSRWRAGFEMASEAARRQHEERREQTQDDDQDEEAKAWADKLRNTLSASSNYITMVEDLINKLNNRSEAESRQMQEHEDTLKLHAVSMERLEKNAIPGFPYRRLYELEKKCQALESHNTILTTKLGISDLALGEQFNATDDFMELSARSLLGMRSEIDAAEHAGLPSQTLNDIYMASITSFAQLTTRISNSLVQDQEQNNTNTDWRQPSGSTLRSVGLKGSRMMSLLPEVPQTPVKKQTASHVLPNVSLGTVDTKLAFGSSSLFGKQSPVRHFQDHLRMLSPQKAPLSPVPFRIGNVLPRKKSSPMPGVSFSPKKQRARGGLRRPRLAPTPTKRSVNFLLDIVAEDEDRYTTGLSVPLPPSKIPRFPSQSPPQRDLMSLGPPLMGSPVSSTLTKINGARRIVPLPGIGSGPRRVAPSGSGSGGPSNSSQPVNPMVAKLLRSELQKGPQRLAFGTSVSSQSSNSSVSSTGSSSFNSPPKRSRAPENDPANKKAKTSPSSKPTSSSHATLGSLSSPPSAPPTPLHISAATVARIARRRSILPEPLNATGREERLRSLLSEPVKTTSSTPSTTSTTSTASTTSEMPNTTTSNPTPPATSNAPTSAFSNTSTSTSANRVNRRRSMLPEPLKSTTNASRAARRRSMLPGPLNGNNNLLKSSPVLTSHEV
ncbi:kinesin-like protein Klp5 [Podila verticillata]|nr:kinesin-like protein Klp5 [Podila verticillata]KAF9211820.1 kinesin-like protein Klp5 [Podila verticillata]